MAFALGRSYPAGEVEKWFLPATTSCGVPPSLDPLVKGGGSPLTGPSALGLV